MAHKYLYLESRFWIFSKNFPPCLGKGPKIFCQGFDSGGCVSKAQSHLIRSASRSIAGSKFCSGAMLKAALRYWQGLPCSGWKALPGISMMLAANPRSMIISHVEERPGTWSGLFSFQCSECQVYLHPEEHASLRHIVLHEASEVLVRCCHHLVSPLLVEVFHL